MILAHDLVLSSTRRVCVTTPAHDHYVVGIVDQSSAETSLKAELLPPQHEPAHVEIRQQWRERRPLRNAAPVVSRLRRPRLPSSYVGFFDGAVQPHLDQMQHAPINDPTRHRLYEVGV